MKITPSASAAPRADRKSTRLNSSHTVISYAVFCLKKKKKNKNDLEHVDTEHAKMMQAECEGIYRSAWDSYYTPDHLFSILFFFFNDTATTEIYTLSLHDALPI